MSLLTVQQWVMSRKTQLLFLAILLLGIFARSWEFLRLPPGLHHDEASIGVDAYYLYRYGVDRQNISYPMHFIAWGNGQNAPYAYLLVPLIALFGLSVPVIRLPILLSGIATLPLIYLIFKRTVDEKFGLLAMFCMAISPWHILLSRWGLESNLLPLFFSAAYFLVLKTKDDWRWFIPANIVFALCLYTYGITYAFLPIFILISLVILYRYHILNMRQILIGLAILVLLGLPVILFVAVNFFRLDSIHIGPVTIPRMPTLSRFQQEGVMFQSNVAATLVGYFKALMNLLIFQNDFRARNVFPPYGYFYGITFPLALVGIWGVIQTLHTKREEKLLWLTWLGSAVILGTLEPVIINRINIIFIPLIALMAYSIYWLGTRFRYILPVAVVVLLIAFSMFTSAYHGEDYRLEAGKEFYTGLLPALQLAQEQTDGPICITNEKVYMPYIFVLYTEKTPPTEFIANVQYRDSDEPLREVDRLGRYTFGLQNCGDNPESAYILFRTERPDRPRDYKRMPFDYFTLYLPKQ